LQDRYCSKSSTSRVGYNRIYIPTNDKRVFRMERKLDDQLDPTSDVSCLLYARSLSSLAKLFVTWSIKKNRLNKHECRRRNVETLVIVLRLTCKGVLRDARGRPSRRVPTHLEITGRRIVTIGIASTCVNIILHLTVGSQIPNRNTHQIANNWRCCFL